MKISKTTQSLILISVIAVVFDLARLGAWGATDPLYLIWNLFLAWIPYIISSNFIKKDMRTSRFILFFILWLLFFPNAPYLVTDVLHIAGRLSPLLWYDSLLFFFFGWIGLLLGMLSLFHIHQYLKARWTHLISELVVFAICCISSFGIYLGRFERWNSWDIFVNPFQLARHSLNVSTNILHAGNPLMFVVVFTVFMYSIYQTMYFLKSA
jgi:uncharacterized membrane protein